MKKFLRTTLGIVCLALTATQSQAQCATGYNSTSLNWDLLDYFPYTGNYTSANGFLPSNAQARTQYFAFGTQRLTITHNFADANSLGENGTHTGETGSYGNGEDINFTANGTITFTFETEVRNFKMSIYDLDNSQSVTVTGANAASAAQNIALSKATGSSVLVIAGSGTTSASVTSVAVGNAATTSNTATVNIDVAGPVKSVTLAFGGTAGDFWLSDVEACSVGTFPTNYYAVSQPFTGQGGYVMHAYDDAVYAVNPATGATKLLFIDSTGLGNVNSMGYDPYNKILYYVYSLTNSGTTGTARKLMKYDFNTETISTVLADLTTIGIPMVTTGPKGPAAESGGACFYNGSYYIGIESGNGTRTSGREAIIWRVDFNTGGVPYRASQVFAVPIDGNVSGNNLLLHDWSDFVIKDGVLINFDAAENDDTGIPSATRNQSDIYHVDLQTGDLVNQYAKPGAAATPTWYPGQPVVDWNGNLYTIYCNPAAPATSQGQPQALPYISPYNGTGNIGTKTTMTATTVGLPTYPSIGDAAEAFKPKADFGDAPSSYDPVALSPAVHENIDAILRLGANVDREWTFKGQSALANSDSYDDAIISPSIFNPLSSTYLIQIPVFNNTGANATLCAWLDFNGNGVFDPAEGIVQTISSGASVQNTYLYWSSAPSSLANGTYTYLRIRITSASNSMTVNNATGYFSNGEVEDYRIPVNDYVLSTKVLDFSAERSGTTAVKLAWDVLEEQANATYSLQRSANQQNWMAIGEASGKQGKNVYTHLDRSPLNGRSYYRLKIVHADGTTAYSEVRKVDFEGTITVVVSPNPAPGDVKMAIGSDRNMPGKITIIDMSGRTLFNRTIQINKGQNSFILPSGRLGNGMYHVVLETERGIHDDKLIIKR